MQVGMQPGPYRFTVSKDGYQSAVIATAASRSASPPQIPDFKLVTAAQAAQAGGRPSPRSSRTAFRRPSTCRPPASRRGRGGLQGHPGDSTRTSPRSTRTSARSTRRRRTIPAAETAFLKVLELRPDSADIADPARRRLPGRRASRTRRWRSWTSPRARTRRTRRRSSTAGIFLLNANKNEEAIEAFEAAIKADPNSRGLLPPGRADGRPGQDPRGDPVPREVPRASTRPTRRTSRPPRGCSRRSRSDRRARGRRPGADRPGGGARVARPPGDVRSSPSARPTRRRRCARPSRPASATSARTASRRPSRRSRRSPTSRGRPALAPRRAPAVEQGAARGRALRHRPVRRLARSRPAPGARRGRSRVAPLRGLVAGGPRGRGRPSSASPRRSCCRRSRPCAASRACGSRG